MAQLRIFPILLILALCAFAYARFTTAEMEVETEWDIKSSGQIIYANLSISIPSNSSNQKVTSIWISEPYTLETNGSTLRANIEMRNFSEKKIQGKFTISTDYIKRTPTYEVSYAAYLGTSELVDTTDEMKTISQKFSSLPFPHNTIALNDWIHENIAYDKVCAVSSYPASWVLKNKKGVCDEFSHLFAAISRPMGVPTRIIIGYAYDGDEWVPHAWTEVYNKGWGWVELDPTHNEFLNLDALRVRTGTGADQEETRDMILASGATDNLSMSSSTAIKVLRKGNSSNIELNIELSPQSENSTEQPVVVIVRNRNKDPMFFTASLISPQGTVCNGCSDSVLLQPGEKKTLSYIINLTSLVPNMKYTFPIRAVTEYGSVDGSFDRLQIAREYTTVQELPPQFMMFIGIAVAAVIILIIAVILLKI